MLNVWGGIGYIASMNAVLSMLALSSAGFGLLFLVLNSGKGRRA